MTHLLHQLVTEAATAAGDHAAIVDGDRFMTYAMLDARSNQVAHLLIEAGVRAGDRVGLYLDKSLEAIVGLHGVLKAGATYVPFDPHAPVARLGYLAGNCGIRCLVTGAEKARSWAGIAETGAPITTYVVLNASLRPAPGPGPGEIGPPGARILGLDALDACPTEPPLARGTSVDLAYILYTSGSMGEPKGVMLSHRNALTFVDWSVGEFGVGPDDRLSSHAPLHFDLSVFDVFASARAAATLALVPPRIAILPVEVARFIEDKQISIWYSVPSILSMLSERGNLSAFDLTRLRTVLFAGEVFPTRYLRQLMRQIPHARFCNLYGPTETNVCTYFDVAPLPDNDDESIPIGKAVADVELFVIAEDGTEVPPGELGELYVRGSTVMQGYWGDADRTEQSLVPHPTQPGLLHGAYRTGDLVQQRPDGNFAFLGRRDSQIKSRGYRIELGEVESALYANPSLKECAVVAIPDGLVSNRIHAFVVVADGVGEPDLIRFCAKRIPRYMIPDSFELRDALPKTATGKIDRSTLAREAASQASAWPSDDPGRETA